MTNEMALVIFAWVGIYATVLAAVAAGVMAADWMRRRISNRKAPR